MLPWWLKLWRRLCGLFRRRRPPVPSKPPSKPDSLADAMAEYNRAHPPKRKPPPVGLRPLRQVPATKEDIKRLGKQAAVAIALGENAKRVQRATIRASDGELYVVWHGGTMVKTNGDAAALPDGTLMPLPPDPRPTKRERAKARRQLKHKERK